MISVENLSVTWGNFVLLNEINFHVSNNDKIGLVGKNGAGKSTILKIMAGIQQPTSGRVEKPSDLSIGYLPQIMQHNKGLSVLEETMKAFEQREKLQTELERMSIELERRNDYESPEYTALITRMSELQESLDMSFSEPAEVMAGKTLIGLGFREDELERQTETFSQGWNMRIELAKILLKKPQLLLLDEPTNHLDIESIEWLEDYLKRSNCALMMVSHDRRFLDSLTSRTIEIMLGNIHDYKVPYSKYVDLRKERIAQQRAAWENQQKMIQKTQEFIQTFRYKPTKSNQVQSRIKALEKLEIIEIDETDNLKLNLKFPPCQRSGDVVFKAENLTLGYPEKTVLQRVNLEIRRGEKVAFLGRNGEGKTTMIKAITGKLSPFEGSAKLGHNVNVGYFAQNQEEALDSNDTVFSTLDRVARGDIRTKLRDILAQFLFRGEDIDKKVSVLSGGERARLGMAKLMLESHNLLVLDEPTNHMDINSKDILKQALSSYDGTLILVSHDRDFLDGLAQTLYEFRDGKLKCYQGGVLSFLESRKLQDFKELERKSKPSKAENKETKKLDEEQRREKQREDRKKKQRISYIEARISELEAEIQDMERLLSEPQVVKDIVELSKKYAAYKQELEDKTEEWIKLMED